MITEVTGRHDEVRQNLVLNRKVPVLRLRGIQVVRHCCNSAERRKLRVLAVDGWEWTAARIRCPRIVIPRGVDRHIVVEGWRDRRPEVGLNVQVVIGKSCGTSYRCFSVASHVPGETKPRRKDAPVHFASTLAWVSRIARVIEPQGSIRIHGAFDSSCTTFFTEVLDGAFLEDFRKIRFPAQTVVESPSPRHFP